ncbi:MAG: tRNA (guanosine(46)-N7)-methyltransferase TrmB [bacterium]
MAPPSELSYPAYRLYGRKQDKPLKPRQALLMQELLPQLSVDAEAKAIQKFLTQQGQRPLWLEIGFGGGEHLAWQAQQNPEVTFIGVEPFINGVAKLLSHIEDKQLNNIRILHGDARPLLECLPDNSLSRVFILHPDPWPKKRHHKRRIISAETLFHIARCLITGGEFRLASDIDDYIRWTLMQVRKHNQQSEDFIWTARRAEDWTIRPDDWPQTRYEAKAIREGRSATYLSFRRQ